MPLLCHVYLTDEDDAGERVAIDQQTIVLVVTTSTVHRQHVAPLVILTTNQPVSCS